MDGCGYSRCLGLIFWNAKKEHTLMYVPTTTRPVFIISHSFVICLVLECIR